MTQTKTAILILGPHRSGTSAIAGAVAQLTKANFGQLLMQAQYDNQQGFYENEKIVAINDAILAELFRSWDDPRPMDIGLLNSTRLDYLRSRAQKVIQDEFDKSEVIAIKDPRLCLTFPFWDTILKTEGYSPRVILTHRKIEEIVASLMSRELLSQEYAYLLTAMYALHAERYTRDHQRIWIDYNRVITEKKYLNLRLGSFLSNIELTLNVDSGLDASYKNSNEHASLELFGDSRYESISLALKEIKKASDEDATQPNATLLERASNAYDDIISEKGPSILRSRVDYGKVVFKYKRQKDRVIHTYKLENNGTSLNFNWIADNRPDKILIIPIHRSANIIDFDIQLIGEETYQISHNSTWERAKMIGFEDSQPRIVLKLRGEQRSLESTCSISYWHEEYQPLIQPKKSIYRIALSATMALLARPHKVLGALNRENWRTLRSALKRESPKQIIRNFTRLVNRKESTGNIAIESVRLKQPKGKKYTRNIIYVSPTIPRFDQSSGERRADIILEILGRSSQIYCKIRTVPQQDYVDRLAANGVQIIRESQKNWKEVIGKVDIVIYDKYYTYNDELGMREYFPNARHIIDTVDVHWVREFRGRDSDPEFDKSRAEKNKKREVNAYLDADEIWAVTQPDSLAIMEEGVSSDVIKNISNIHPVHANLYTPWQKPILFFLGNYNHNPNEWTAIWLASEVYPIIKKSHPKAQLWLAGAEATQEVSDLSHIEGVSVLGYIEEDKLADIYSQSALVLAPLVAGAGVKGKLLEAISYMTPLLTNDIGNEGINIQHEKEGFIVNDKTQIAETVVNILNNKYDLEQIAQNAQKNVLSRFTYAAAQKTIESSLYPCVDICIVTHNRLELLRSCISSIMHHTRHPNFRIKVYSNACIDGTTSYLEELEKTQEQVSVIYSDTNDVFVKPNNDLMATSTNDVLLLNNDTEVTPGWLMGLQTIAYREKEIGIVGPALTYVDGSVQEIGSEIYSDGTGMNYFNRYSLKDIEFKEPHAVPYVSGCAMYIKRTMLDEIGPFDTSFHPCYFEDSDLCYRAWNRNYKVVVVPEVIVTHYGGATAGVDTDQGYKSYQLKNAQIFLEKHKYRLHEVKSLCKVYNKTISLV